MGELYKKTWGGYRHGRKRRSSINIAALHVNVRRETHTMLKRLAERQRVTMGEVVDRLLEKYDISHK